MVQLSHPYMTTRKTRSPNKHSNINATQHTVKGRREFMSSTLLEAHQKGSISVYRKKGPIRKLKEKYVAGTYTIFPVWININIIPFSIFGNIFIVPLGTISLQLQASREQQRVRWLDDVTDSMDMNLSKLQEMATRHAAVHGVEKSRTQLGWTNWKEGFPDG